MCGQRYFFLENLVFQCALKGIPETIRTMLYKRADVVCQIDVNWASYQIGYPDRFIDNVSNFKEYVVTVGMLVNLFV